MPVSRQTLDASSPDSSSPPAPRTITVAHSPDSDDAFMFYALAEHKIDTEGLTYVHELQDIETLNQRARRGELEVTAVSIHAYAYIADQYALLPHGASMGDRYGPRLVTRAPMTRDDLRGERIAGPRPAHERLPRAAAVAAGVRGGADGLQGGRGRGGGRRRRGGAHHPRGAAHLPGPRASTSPSTSASGGTARPGCRSPRRAT
jgi:hypothetical protein